MNIQNIAAFPVAAKTNDNVKIVKSSGNTMLLLIEGSYYVYDKIAKTTTKII